MQPPFANDVREFIVGNFLFGRENSLNDDESFLEQGIIDSTGILELVTFLEETYAIQITDEELIPANLDTVNRIAAYLARKLNGEPSVTLPRSEEVSTPA